MFILFAVVDYNYESNALFAGEMVKFNRFPKSDALQFVKVRISEADSVKFNEIRSLAGRQYCYC